MNQTGTGTVRNNEKLSIDRKNKVIQLTGERYQRDISFKISRPYIRFYDQFPPPSRLKPRSFTEQRLGIKSVFEGTYNARPRPTLVSFGPLRVELNFSDEHPWLFPTEFSPPGDTMPTIVQLMTGMAGILALKQLAWIEILGEKRSTWWDSEIECSKTI